MRTSSINNGGKKFKSTSKKNQTKRSDSGSRSGRISVVGIGPGSLEHLTPKARSEIEAADVVVGYRTYIKLIQGIVRKDAELLSGTMGKEVERAKIAVDKANKGNHVVLVSSGDPGVYGMAGIVLEVAAVEEASVAIEIVPGVTAATACSAVLGAPLVSDFAVISLSDLLTPWEKIERRLEAAASADFSIILYNPQSRGRVEPLTKAYEILLNNIDPKTPVGVVHQVGREGERFFITTLKEMLNYDIDMTTTIVIGNSATKIINGKMVTARGYDIERKQSEF
jgi:precorrin-3B C17-methyltransferase